MLRTIRNGNVTINGNLYKPDLDASQFNGMRAAFGLYWIGNTWDDKSVFLHSSEKAYRSDDPETDWPGPFCEDGYFKWEWWHKQVEGVTS